MIVIQFIEYLKSRRNELMRRSIFALELHSRIHDFVHGLFHEIDFVVVYSLEDLMISIYWKS